jgi:hypothetical protein
MLKYDVYLQLHATGTGVESQVLMMSMLAHLYAACRFSYREDPVWPDMEFMMERQDKSRLFLGGQPKTFKEASRKLVLAGGASVSNFARRRRDDKVIIDPDSTQYFQDRSVLGTLYQERMYREPSTSEATDLTRKLIQTIKSSSRASKRVSRVGNLISTQSSNLNRDWRPLEVMEELREWLVEDAIDLCWDWHCMNQICGDMWTKIKTAFDRDPQSPIKDMGTSVGMAGMILNAGAEVERLLEEHSVLRQYVRDENPDRCPELTVVRNIIQQTIQTQATPPNRPIGWLGDRCIRRLLHVSPEAIRPLGRPGGLNAKNLYVKWDVEKIQESQVILRLDQFVAAYEKFEEAQAEFRKVDAGEADCEECNERHVPGKHKPVASQQGFYFCSPITRAAWGAQ